VELIGQHTGDVVEIQVRDHGVGFTDSYRAHPFVRFAPTASTGRGSGLGLAIVQAITKAHGGVVSLSNDHGAAVTVSFPADPARPVAAPEADPSALATATAQERQWSSH
jgi:signal transduction histidine kinase